VLRIVMLDGVGEGERLCPQFPLTPPSPHLPSFSYYSYASVGGERCVQRHSYARATAFIFLYLQEREGERSFQHSPSRSARQLSPSSGSVRGKLRWMFAPHAPRHSGVSPTGVVRKAPDMEQNEQLCSLRFDEMRRT
jgi:hypothetical protein